MLQMGDIRPVQPTFPMDGSWSGGFGRDPHTPLGPQAVLADGDGFALLDQESRLLRRYEADGTPRGELSIPSRSTLDAAALGGGDYGLLVYDREDGASWKITDLSGGGEVGRTRLVPDADVPSAIFAEGDAVLVEQAHDWTVDVATGTRFPGRPDGDGRYVRAQKDGPQQLTLTWSDADGKHPERVVLQVDRTLASVIALDPSPERTMVAMMLYDEGPAPDFEMLRAEHRVLVLDSAGTRYDEFSLELESELDVARPLALDQEGHLYQLRTTRDGLRVASVEVLP